MRMTILRAAILALGVAALASPVAAQTTGSQQSLDNKTPAGAAMKSGPAKNKGMTSSSKSSRSHHARNRHHGRQMGTTGMGAKNPTPGNPAKELLAERWFNTLDRMA